MRSIYFQLLSRAKDLEEGEQWGDFDGPTFWYRLSLISTIFIPRPVQVSIARWLPSAAPDYRNKKEFTHQLQTPAFFTEALHVSSLVHAVPHPFQSLPNMPSSASYWSRNLLQITTHMTGAVIAIAWITRATSDLTQRGFVPSALVS